jgi:undecaprenyl diphosphate synthase
MTDRKIPQCIGIILDGNRRWAKAKNLPSIEGHTKGFKNVETITRVVKHAGLKHLVVYAFSTENWQRSQEEVSYLMGLVLELARDYLKQLISEGVQVRFVGERDRLSNEVREAVEKIEHDSKAGEFMLWVCLSYGGRAEIIEAARKLQKSGEEITEQSFSEHLWTTGMPDPDLIIRTGGAQILSNFLPWQSTYSELFFTDTYWPDFSETELKKILEEYAARERRMGK